jgi:hypothetical protein
MSQVNPKEQTDSDRDVDVERRDAPNVKGGLEDIDDGRPPYILTMGEIKVLGKCRAPKASITHPLCNNL